MAKKAESRARIKGNFLLRERQMPQSTKRNMPQLIEAMKGIIGREIPL